jgi:predicted O-methyltransferase YrrM
MYDLVFIDADKENYIEYFKQVSERLNKNGIIISDNVLWSGKVLDSSLEKDEETNALVNFNKILNEDKRFETVILPLRDGLSISRLI